MRWFRRPKQEVPTEPWACKRPDCRFMPTGVKHIHYLSYTKVVEEKMKKPTLFNLEITLNCARCKKEVPMENPFEINLSESIRDIPQMFNDCINRAYTNHQARAECKPPGCIHCGGDKFPIGQTGSHADRIDCIKHLRALIVDLYRRLPTTTSSITYKNPPITFTDNSPVVEKNP